MPRMSRLDPSLKIRLPEGMRDVIGVAARKNRRSMNAEIVMRLAESFGMAAPEIEPGDVPDFAHGEGRPRKGGRP